MPHQQDISLTTSLAASLRRALARDESFSTFELGLGPEALRELQALKVSKTDSYDNFTSPETLGGDVKRFLTGIGNTPEDAAGAAAHIEKMVAQIKSGFGAEAAWVTIRASLPTDAFDVPRWHRDGSFFDGAGEQRKAAAVIKGPQTLLNDLPQSLSEKFTAMLRSFEDDTTENRRELEKLVDARDTRMAKDGEGIIFVVGSDRAAVHSEPAIHSERIFVSVVPGTKAQIEELRTRWQCQPASYHAAPKA
jgi:hypothetical protein